MPSIDELALSLAHFHMSQALYQISSIGVRTNPFAYSGGAHALR